MKINSKCWTSSFSELQVDFQQISCEWSLSNSSSILRSWTTSISEAFRVHSNLHHLQLPWRTPIISHSAFASPHRTIVNTSSAINLNNDPRNKLLHTFDLSRLIGFLVELSALTAGPISHFPVLGCMSQWKWTMQKWKKSFLPESGTWLAVTFHQAFVDNGLLEVGAFFRWVRFGSVTSTYTTDYGLLRSTPTNFAAWRKTYYFP
jgi:hypothetical protein